MSNIEKIRQEIKRLNDINKQIAKEQGCTDFIRGINAGYLDVLSFLDSQSEEKPSEDLEVAAEKYLDTLEVAELFCGSYEAWQVSDAFKAGAEWQKQRDAELIEIAYNDGITIGKTKQKKQMTKVSEEDALLLERAWLTLDNFGHEELAEWLRQFVYRQK